jgi:hypothetical protein
LDRRLGKPQSLSGRCGEDKNLALPGIEPRPFYNEENPLFVISVTDCLDLIHGIMIMIICNTS